MTTPARHWRHGGRRRRGFTLVEALVALALIGIIGAMVAVFITVPVQNYADSAMRAQLADEADLALGRMTRELRRALPNSVRVNADGSAIEFLLTKTGGRYLAVEDGLDGAYPPLDFVNGATSVTVTGVLTEAVAAGDFFVVYNLGPGMAPADAWGYGTGESNIARIGAPVAAGSVNPVLTLDDNPFSAQATALPSPAQRFQVVSGPVLYACARSGGGGSGGGADDAALVLTRYAGYAIRAEQANPPTGAGARAALSRHVRSCAGLFSYDTGAALVGIALELAAPTPTPTTSASTAPGALDGPVLRLVQQVHVDNVP